MDLKLQRKVAWVLGASSGLGRGAATALAQEGADVVVSARDGERLTAAARAIAAETGATCLPIPVDVTDAAAITRAAQDVTDRLGGIDILVANAGGVPPGPFDRFADDDLFDAFTLTTASAWRATKAVVSSMRARGGGVIVYITSVSTKEVLDGLILSNMMRPAVLGMAKTLSRELAADNIRVNCIAPGYHDTPRVRELEQERATSQRRSVEEIRAERNATVPIGRLGDAREFGDAVAFLASDAAGYISGVTLTVDGGALRTLTA